LLEEERYLSLNNKLLTANLLLQRFYKLLFLAITAGAQANIPTPRIEGVLFPNYIVSCEFNGPDFSTNYSNACLSM
jgi:hypothetical protein